MVLSSETPDKEIINKYLLSFRLETLTGTDDYILRFEGWKKIKNVLHDLIYYEERANDLQEELNKIEDIYKETILRQRKIIVAGVFIITISLAINAGFIAGIIIYSVNKN